MAMSSGRVPRRWSRIRPSFSLPLLAGLGGGKQGGYHLALEADPTVPSHSSAGLMRSAPRQVGPRVRGERVAHGVAEFRARRPVTGCR